MMKHYLLWQIMGSYRAASGKHMDVILYRTYDQDGVNFEMEREGDRWNREGYEGLWITGVRIATPPDSERYLLIKPIDDDY